MPKISRVRPYFYPASDGNTEPTNDNSTIMSPQALSVNSKIPLRRFGDNYLTGVKAYMDLDPLPDTHFEKEMDEMVRQLEKFKIDDPQDRFHLGDLPPELVLNINQYLPHGSSLSLAATCKELRAIIPIVAPEGYITQKEFTGYLNRDAFSRAYKSEIQNEDPAMRACVGCNQLHPKDHFSIIQLHYPVKLRKCRGQNGLTHICNHTGLSWNYLKETLDPRYLCRKNKPFENFYSCQQHCQAHAMVSLTQSPPGDQPNKTFMMESLIGSVRLRIRKDSSSIVFQELLRKELSVKICPHSTVAKALPRVHDALVALKFDFARQDEPITSCFRGGCTEPKCGARVWIVRYLYRNTRNLRLDIHTKRDLGPLEAPSDPKWINNIEPPRLASTSRPLDIHDFEDYS